MEQPLVQVRTPTYKRPRELFRALQSVREQTWPHWVADVYDDDPLAAGREVCAQFGDPRIRYHHNASQRFASRNIDACFSAENSSGADYFCVVEDDNFLLPGFMEQNIQLCQQKQVDIVLRNQFVEHKSGTDDACVGTLGVLDHLLVEGIYGPESFRMSLLLGIGVSNGGLFWSQRARSKLEIGFPCTATIQEYMRTFSVVEPIYVAMTPLAVWAENAGQTTRNMGLSSSYLRRELDLKRRIQALQGLVWNESLAPDRRDFLNDRRFVPGADQRSRALAKALIPHRPKAGVTAMLRLVGRGLAIRAFGRLGPDFDAFLRTRQRPGGAVIQFSPERSEGAML